MFKEIGWVFNEHEVDARECTESITRMKGDQQMVQSHPWGMHSCTSVMHE